MKLVTLFTFISVSQAYLGEDCTTGAGGFAVCNANECCGTAVPQTSGSGTNREVCNTNTDTLFVDTSGNHYDFSCNSDNLPTGGGGGSTGGGSGGGAAGGTDGASSLIVSTSAVLTALYLLS